MILKFNCFAPLISTLKKSFPLQILFEDEHLLIVNKASGDVVIPERNGVRENSLVGKLEAEFGKVFVVHRIDKPTSGIVCFAKDEATHRSLSMMFESRKIEKEYLAVVKGKVKPEKGTVDFALAENLAKPGTMKVHARGKDAITDYELLEQFKHAALVKFVIHTGRMHQIRVHAATIGNPLLVDDLYSGSGEFFISKFISKYKATEASERPTIARLTLHAYTIGFIHPATNKKLVVTAPLPKDLDVLLKLLRKHDA